MDAVDQLCPNCGLCCDSTLFADVELRAGDDAKQLAKLGLVLKRKERTKTAFAQPCACFDGKLCTIYADRPKRCWLFECGLLKKVKGGRNEGERGIKENHRGKYTRQKGGGFVEVILCRRTDGVVGTLCAGDERTGGYGIGRWRWPWEVTAGVRRSDGSIAAGLFTIIWW